MLRTADTVRVAMSADLLTELGEKDEDRPELLAVVEMPADDLGRIEVGRDFLGLVLDRPASPGNLGSIIRSADAFGAAGVVVTGHAADPYDPRSVRASTGSLFARPVVRLASPRELTAWLAAQRARGYPIALAGADEGGEREVFDADLTVPTLLVMGNETAGLSTAWRERCDYLVRIPMTGFRELAERGECGHRGPVRGDPAAPPGDRLGALLGRQRQRRAAGVEQAVRAGRAGQPGQVAADPRGRSSRPG